MEGVEYVALGIVGHLSGLPDARNHESCGDVLAAVQIDQLACVRIMPKKPAIMAAQSSGIPLVSLCSRSVWSNLLHVPKLDRFFEHA